jgi:hypothetical protein
MSARSSPKMPALSNSTVTVAPSCGDSSFGSGSSGSASTSTTAPPNCPKNAAEASCSEKGIGRPPSPGNG